MPFSNRHAATETIRHNWAAIILAVAIVFGSAAANWRYEMNVSSSLQHLRGGLCKIVHRSNQLGQENKRALMTTAKRAARRARIDEAAGRTALAQSDRDAARLDRRFALEIKPTILDGCN